MAAVNISVPYAWLYDSLTEYEGGEVKLLSWENRALDQSDLDETDLLVLPFHSLDAAPHHPYVHAGVANDVIARSIGVQLVQLLSVGHEGLAPPADRPKLIANAAGVMEGPTGEHAVALLLSLMRGLLEFSTSQRNQTWNNFTTPGLIGKSVALLGYGGVGSAIDRRLQNFDCRITRFASRARISDSGEAIHPLSTLDTALLSTFDAVVVSLPSTPSTIKFVDAPFLANMKPNAILVNVGRGAVVDTQALVDYASQGHVRAAIDVVDPEPLPSDHPIWSTPNITITPHVGGNSEAVAPALTDLVLRQAHLLGSGKQGLNLLSLPANTQERGLQR